MVDDHAMELVFFFHHMSSEDSTPVVKCPYPRDSLAAFFQGSYITLSPGPSAAFQCRGDTDEEQS